MGIPEVEVFEKKLFHSGVQRGHGTIDGRLCSEELILKDLVKDDKHR